MARYRTHGPNRWFTFQGVEIYPDGDDGWITPRDTLLLNGATATAAQVEASMISAGLISDDVVRVSQYPAFPSLVSGYGNVSGAIRRSLRRFNPVETWSPGSGGAPWSTNGNATSTFQLQLAHRGKPYAFQIGYMNPFTSSYTVDKTTVTPSATFALNGETPPAPL